jgi:hypothetical protein
MKIGGRFLSILLVALIVAGCATPEERRQREAARQAQIQACKSRGGTPYVSKYTGRLHECLSANQQAEADKKRIACTRSGGRPNYNTVNGLLKGCIYPNNNSNPWVFQPYCPPNKYGIYGCPPAGNTNNNSSGDYDWDWDYQPANRQWVCRGIQTGRYAELSNCAWDAKDDDRWPG